MKTTNIKANIRRFFEVVDHFFEKNDDESCQRKIRFQSKVARIYGTKCVEFPLFFQGVSIEKDREMKI